LRRIGDEYPSITLWMQRQGQRFLCHFHSSLTPCYLLSI
jgi:hypothetical protein